VALGLLLAVVGVAGDHALAQVSAIDTILEDPPTIDQLNGGAQPDRLLLFAGFDIWRGGRTGYGGLQWAPDGLDRDGLIARLIIAQGREWYRTPTKTFTTDIFRASLLPGVRVKLGEIELKLFAGVDLEARHFNPDHGHSDLRGSRLGLRAAGEFWWEPSPELMLTGSVFATSIAAGHGGRVAIGRRLLDSFWVGPEFSGSRDCFSTQTRIGAHLTGLKTGEFEWSAAAGYLTDSFDRNGVYVRIGALLRQ
jgi:hypothetical protein